jgi:hypothetical protein
MPEKLGKTFDDKILKSPLTVGRPRKEPGPDVNNPPVIAPADPLKLIPGNSRTVRGGKGD